MELAGFSTIQEARKSWTIEEYGQDVIALIDYLALEHVVLVGHSMGGDIILEAALARPEEVIGFVGVDNFKDVGKAYSKEEQDEIAQFINMLESDFSNVAPAYAQSVLFHTSTDSSIIRRVSQDFASANPEVAVKSLESLLAYGQLEQEKLSKLKVKIYLINSDVTPTRRSGLEASGVAYEVLDIHATGHYPMVEKPEEFNRMLRQVLAAIGAN